VSWTWWKWPMTWLTNYCFSALWHCWLGHLTIKSSLKWHNVSNGTLNPTTLLVESGATVGITCTQFTNEHTVQFWWSVDIMCTEFGDEDLVQFWWSVNITDELLVYHVYIVRRWRSGTVLTVVCRYRVYRVWRWRSGRVLMTMKIWYSSDGGLSVSRVRSLAIKIW